MTKTRDLSDFLVEGGVLDKPIGTPHIVPGVLFPSDNDKQIDGTTALAASTTGPAGSTVTSSKFGTVQSDGRMYYYTDIKGSKPIKDPRIGGHFGSQRHKFKSLQLLEQETATHGKKIYSTDGRDWIKLVDNNIAFSVGNSTWGNVIYFDGNTTNASDSFIEITGYFNDFNMITRTGSNRCDEINAYVNGGNATAVNTLGGRTTQASPLDGRYVDSGSIVNIGSTVSGLLGTTPKINTLKLIFTNSGSEYLHIGGIELIAQDTTSTANKSKIQIPAQEVVSFGKKFSVSAAATHYDPFNGFTSGSSVTSYIDTATSLGVENWKNSSTYYRPYNGGRVVKWVDSSGVIKTSVTLMPPNARSIGNSSSLTNATAKANASIANNTFFPTIEEGAIDHSLAEVAKTFHFREFGNGSANGGIGHANYADASMLDNTGDNIAYVMDDGLSSFAGENVQGGGDGINHTNNDNLPIYITFIGTGFTVELQANGTGSDHYDKYVDGVQVQDGDIARTNGVVVRETLAQNLPYGTHIVKLQRGAETPNVFNEIYKEFTFHQPKMPPIPEDAVVLADYMLMADFVKQTDAETGQISKGVRYCNGSRDHFYGGASAATALTVKSNSSPWGLTGGGSPGSTNPGIFKLPFFGTTGLSILEQSQQAHSIKLNDTATTETALDNLPQPQGDLMSIAESVDLGQTSIETTLITGSYHFFGHLVATPTHTSSHYQAFETPFLNELVGGDRNMEQMNLVCSPDGKTWDEITRDVSYLGESGFSVGSEISHASGNTGFTTFSMYRGGIDGVTKIDTFTVDGTNTNKYKSYYTKDFAPSHGNGSANAGLICLKNGYYQISFGSHTTAVPVYLYVNANLVQTLHRSHTTAAGSAYGTTVVYLDRGDFVQRKGGYENDEDNQYGLFTCHRINRGVH